jgi:hypothetical protein
MTGKQPVLPEKPDERLLIETLCSQISQVLDASNSTPGLKTIATIIMAARYARRTTMPAFVAASMISTYIARGDPF